MSLVSALPAAHLLGFPAGAFGRGLASGNAGTQSFRLPLAVAKLRAPAQKAVAGEPGCWDCRASCLASGGLPPHPGSCRELCPASLLDPSGGP